MKVDWQKRSLGDICEIYQPKTIAMKDMLPDGKYPVFGANGIIGKYDKYNHEEPELLIGCRGTCGSVNISLPKSWINGNAMVIRPKVEGIDRNYLEYFFRGSINISNVITGSAQPQITRQSLSPIKISFPPFLEQKRIVERIDTFMEQIDKAIQNIEQNIKNCEEMFQSNSNEIFNKKEDNWISSKIGIECDLMTGGTPRRSVKEYFENGNIRWLVSGDIHLREIFDCSGRISEQGLDNSNAKYLPKDSVMIALNGQGKTRGTVAMLRVKATCNQSLISIYPKKSSSLLSEYIYANLNSRYIEIRKITGDSGNDRRGLNMPLIRNIDINYPIDIINQKKIIERIKKLRKSINALKNSYQQEIEALNEFKKSILEKAFNGDL